jgi:hypothetical protein
MIQLKRLGHVLLKVADVERVPPGTTVSSGGTGIAVMCLPRPTDGYRAS